MMKIHCHPARPREPLSGVIRAYSGPLTTDDRGMASRNQVRIRARTFAGNQMLR